MQVTLLWDNFMYMYGAYLTVEITDLGSTHCTYMC